MGRKRRKEERGGREEEVEWRAKLSIDGRREEKTELNLSNENW